MKYIKKFEIASERLKKYADYDRKFENGDILVAIETRNPYLIYGHRYIYDKENSYSKSVIYVMDIVNNQRFCEPIEYFISEHDFIYGEDSKKYNI